MLPTPMSATASYKGHAMMIGMVEVHCNGCEGATTGMQTFLRSFQGVHKYYLADYVATYETLANAKRITPAVVPHMFGDRLHISLVIRFDRNSRIT